MASNSSNDSSSAFWVTVKYASYTILKNGIAFLGKVYCQCPELIKQFFEKIGQGTSMNKPALESIVKKCASTMVAKEGEAKLLHFVPFIGCVVGVIFGVCQIYAGKYVLGISSIISGILSIFTGGWFPAATFGVAFVGTVYQIARSINA